MVSFLTTNRVNWLSSEVLKHAEYLSTNLENEKLIYLYFPHFYVLDQNFWPNGGLSCLPKEILLTAPELSKTGLDKGDASAQEKDTHITILK